MPPSRTVSPCLSVVMPNYNHARYLPRSLAALMNQEYEDLEIIVVDDGSTDNSAEIIESITAEDPRVRLVRMQTNSGCLAAVNRGRELASGSYLYNAAADDMVMPGFLKAAMEMAKRYPQAGIIFGKMTMFSEDGVQLAVAEVQAWPEPIYAPPERYLRECIDPQPGLSPGAATIFRRAAFDEVGLRPKLTSWRDTFAARAIALKYGACYLPQECVRAVMHERSYSGQIRNDISDSLSLATAAASLMRTPEFRDRFPEAHVKRWERHTTEYSINRHTGRFQEHMDDALALAGQAFAVGKGPCCILGQALARWMDLERRMVGRCMGCALRKHASESAGKGERASRQLAGE